MAFPEIPPLTLSAFVGLFERGMKRRIAHREMEDVLRRDHACEYVVGVALMPKRDIEPVARANLLRRLDRGRINIDADHSKLCPSKQTGIFLTEFEFQNLNRKNKMVYKCSL